MQTSYWWWMVVLSGCQMCHTSNKQPLKVVTVFWRRTTFGESTGYQYLNNFCVRKVSSFPFAHFCFPSQIFLNVSIVCHIVCETRLFLMFPLKFYAGNWRARGQNCSPRACPRFDGSVMLKYLRTSPDDQNPPAIIS